MTLPVLASDPGQIEQAADPAGYVILACERAKSWLAHALEHGDIDDIVELKSQAEAIRVYTAQKQIGHDAELAAAEIVRRAERGIGIAVRRGQAAGEITAQHQGHNGPQRAYQQTRNGRTVTIHAQPRDGDVNATLKSPTEIFADSYERRDAYVMTDDVSDEQFEKAVDVAKAEQNLSRANVIRKVRAVKAAESLRDLDTPAARRQAIRELAAKSYTSRQISEMVGITDEHVRYLAREMGIAIDADKVIGRTRRHDSNRIVEETVHALDGLRMGVELIDFSTLDRGKVPGWSSALTASLRSLNQLARRLKELDQP